VHYPLEVDALSTADEVNDDVKDDAPQKRDRGDGNKDESFIVNLHGLPYNATLEDVAEFLEGLQFIEAYEKPIGFKKLALHYVETV